MIKCKFYSLITVRGFFLLQFILFTVPAIAAPANPPKQPNNKPITDTCDAVLEGAILRVDEIALAKNETADQYHNIIQEIIIAVRQIQSETFPSDWVNSFIDRFLESTISLSKDSSTSPNSDLSPQTVFLRTDEKANNILNLSPLLIETFGYLNTGDYDDVIDQLSLEDRLDINQRIVLLKEKMKVERTKLIEVQVSVAESFVETPAIGVDTRLISFIRNQDYNAALSIVRSFATTAKYLNHRVRPEYEETITALDVLNEQVADLQKSNSTSLSIELKRELIEKGARTNLELQSLDLELMNAINSDDPANLERLLDLGANLPYAYSLGVDSDQVKVELYASALRGHNDILEPLVNFFKLNVNGPPDWLTLTTSAAPPVLGAAEGNHFDTYTLLVDRLGADPHAVNKDHNQNVMHIAAQKGYLDFIRKTRDKYGVDIYALDIFKEMPMHSAVRNTPQLNVVRFFKEEMGMDIDTRDGLGRTVAISISRFNDPKAIDEMRALGANFKLVDNTGRGPFMHAVRMRSFEAAKRIVEHDNEAPRIVDNGNNNALHLYFEESSKLDEPDVVRAELFYLVKDLKLDPSAYATVTMRYKHAPVDDIAYTPLYLAITKGHIDGLRILIEELNVNPHKFIRGQTMNAAKVKKLLADRWNLDADKQNSILNAYREAEQIWRTRNKKSKKP